MSRKANRQSFFSRVFSRFSHGKEKETDNRIAETTEEDHMFSQPGTHSKNAVKDAGRTKAVDLNQIHQSNIRVKEKNLEDTATSVGETFKNSSRYLIDSEFVKAAETAVCAVIDTETTGLGKDSRLLDIGIVLIEKENITATLSQLTNPGTANTPGAIAVNHITQDMLIGQPTPSQVLAPILEAIRTLPLMGHNLQYDIDIINKEAELAGIPGLKPAQVFDTMDLSQEMFPDASSHTLASLLDRLGVEEPEQHRALSDALQTWQAYRLLCVMDGPRVETEEEKKRSLRRGKAKTREVMRARYLSDKSTNPVNEKPEGVQLDAQGGENLSGCALYQGVLRKYPRGSYFWVTLSQDYIRSGKYRGYPTIYVYLDGEEIGFLGASLMAKHWGQIPDGSVIALAHTSECADETKPYKARVELPAAHVPTDLTPYMMKVGS